MISGKSASRGHRKRVLIGVIAALLIGVMPAGGGWAQTQAALRVSGPFGSVTAQEGSHRRQAVAAVKAVRRESWKYLKVRGVKFQFVDQKSVRAGQALPPRPDEIPFHWQFPPSPDVSRQAEGALIGLLRHELGHQVFLRRVLVPSRRDGYGSDAPDWLDEAAAIVMETPEMKDQRRAMARMLAAQGKLLPLGDFLAMSHPEAKSGVDRLASASPNGTFVPKNPFQTLIFYSQCQVFTDFLISKTGEPDILRKLADAIGRNEDYVAVLVEEIAIGAGQNSLDEINSMFLSWVREHTPPGGKER